MPQPVEEVIPVPGEDTTNSQILDAIKQLTETMGDVVESLNAMRDEYKLKTRAGIFDQKGVS